MSSAAPGPRWCWFWGAMPMPPCTQPGVLAQGGETHPGVWGGCSLGPTHPLWPNPSVEQLSPVWLIPLVDGAHLHPQNGVPTPGLVLSWVHSSLRGQRDTQGLSWHWLSVWLCRALWSHLPQCLLSLAELPPSEFMQVADSTWLVLSVVSNGREPPGCQATGVTKIARSVIAPLAEHHVSVLMLSTYQTDFILVSDRHGGTWLAVPRAPLCPVGGVAVQALILGPGAGAGAGPARGDPHAGRGV